MRLGVEMYVNRCTIHWVFVTGIPAINSLSPFLASHLHLLHTVFSEDTDLPFFVESEASKASDISSLAELQMLSRGPAEACFEMSWSTKVHG